MLDYSIEHGVVAAEYPVLVISQDGTFRTYRLGTDCAVDDTFKPELSEQQRKQRCIETKRTRQADLGESAAILVTEGALIPHRDGRWKFDQSDAGAALRQQIAQTRDDIFLVRGTPFSYLFSSKLSESPVAIQRFGSQLELTGSNPPWKLTLTGYSKEILSDAAVTLEAISVPYGPYFRCIVAAYGSAHSKTPSSQELIELRRRSRDFLRLAHMRAEAYAELLLRQTGLASLRWSSQDEQMIDSAYEELKSSPGFIAAAANKFGAYLGCAEKDSWNQ